MCVCQCYDNVSRVNELPACAAKTSKKSHMIALKSRGDSAERIRLALMSCAHEAQSEIILSECNQPLTVRQEVACSSLGMHTF